MNVRILSAAEYEFLDAVHYYNTLKLVRRTNSTI
jgi:hypothetical protein